MLMLEILLESKRHGTNVTANVIPVMVIPSSPASIKRHPAISPRRMPLHFELPFLLAAMPLAG